MTAIPPPDLDVIKPLVADKPLSDELVNAIDLKARRVISKGDWVDRVHFDVMVLAAEIRRARREKR